MGDFKNKFSWSLLRHNTFKECKRKYYYHYYGFWNGWLRSADEATRTLYVLKQLKNRWSWKGLSVHDEIARILKQLTTTGALYPLKKSLERITRLMRSEFLASRDGTYREKYGSLRDETPLFEHAYDVPLSDREWKQVNEEAKECLRNFYRSDVLASLKRIDSEDIIHIDSRNPPSFELMNEKIFANLDLAYREGDSIKIIDWKMGESEADELQFAIYAFYIRERTQWETEKTLGIDYNLHTSQKRTYRFSDEEIEEALDFISESIGEMKRRLRDPLENVALMADFERTEDDRKCEFCNFKGICFDLD